ncbi:MAG: hypothetical protein AAGI45_23115 [Cyanobacteria bacterium P01_H01_bin.26]
MTSDHHSKEKDLQTWEATLREREINIRLRELEAELETSAKAQKPVARSGGLPKIVQFGAIVVGVIVVVRLVTWLATLLLVAGLVWAGYKIFFDGDHG